MITELTDVKIRIKVAMTVLKPVVIATIFKYSALRHHYILFFESWKLGIEHCQLINYYKNRNNGNKYICPWQGKSKAESLHPAPGIIYITTKFIGILKTMVFTPYIKL